MAKDSVSEWSTSASGNTDVGGNNIAEGCPPSGINNAIRTIMAQVKSSILGSMASLAPSASGNQVIMTTGTNTVTLVNVGTSGSAIPRLNGSSTWSGQQTFTADNPLFLTSSAPTIRLTDTDTGASSTVSANSSNGSLTLSADVGNQVAGSNIYFVVDGNSVANITAAGNLELSGTVGISSGGTGASTAASARSNLGLGTAATADTGSSGARVPFMNGSNTWSGDNTWSGMQTFTGSNSILLSSSAPGIFFDDTDTGARCQITGNTSTGSLSINADLNNQISGSQIVFTIDGNTMATLTAAGNLSLTGNLGISSGGTGATTASSARSNLGLGGLATMDIGDLVYNGSDTGNTTFPVGSYVAASRGTTYNRNASVSVWTASGSAQFYNLGSGNSQLGGTWRYHGPTSSSDALMRRTA